LSDLAAIAPPDLGARDAQVAPDMATRLDLAAPRDIATPLDLTTPADFAPPGPTSGPFACAIPNATSGCAPSMAFDCTANTTAFAFDGDDVYLVHFNESRPAGPPDPAVDGVYVVHAGTMTLVAPEAEGVALALDADYVYFGGSTGLWSVRKDGSALTQLTDEHVWSIVVDSDRVYYGVEIPPYPRPTEEIHSLPKSGGSPTTLVTGEWIYGFVADATSLYWSSSYGLRTMPKIGGTAKTLTGAGGGPIALAPDGVVFVDAGNTLVSYDPTSGAMAGIALLVPAGTFVSSMQVLAVDDDVAIISYWTADGVHPGEENETDRFDRHSGVVTQFGTGPFFAGALQGGTLYAMYGMPGELVRMCK
jgi:hypothetical protein